MLKTRRKGLQIPRRAFARGGSSLSTLETLHCAAAAQVQIYKLLIVWFGVIFIRHGLYQDGVFKFTVYIPDNYPDGECPKLVFDIPVFHPLVDPVSGELDVRRAFTKWRRNHNHIWQVLMYARTIFYKINTTEPLNPEAAVL
ncbi:AKT-interacting protein [Nibea albiflora]|uniref:AKT-interacting protein n=1 Tax=Nibea albiflora TaxID=240163 RepID=A0ACB7EHI8_NIBAL|nr:AKT-interacting protein [Nibea albiflora]